MTKKLNSNHLKFIAIAAMTVDHTADLLLPCFPANPIAVILHIIGRITAPIMWFFICEGFHYTHNLKKYIGRMVVFAVISHFAYCFAFGINLIPFSTGEILNQTSVIFPLCGGLCALWVMFGENNLKQWQKYALLILIDLVTFPSDWSRIAVMAIPAMYGKRGNPEKQTLNMTFWVLIYAAVIFFAMNKVQDLIKLGVILIYPLIKTYNGERGKAKWTKRLFYIYYPAHLVIIGIIRIAVYGNVPIL